MREVIQTLTAFTRPYPWMIPAVVILGLAASIAEGLGIGLLIPLLDGVMGRVSTPEGPFAGLMQALGMSLGTERGPIWVAVSIVLLIVLKTVILGANLWLMTVVAGRVTRDLRTALVNRLLAIDYQRFAALEPGRAVNAIDAQSQRAGDAITLLGSLLACACNVAVFSVLLFLLSWRMALIVAVLAVPVVMVVRVIAHRAHRHGQRFIDAQAVLTGEVLDILGAMRIIRVFSREVSETKRFRRSADESYRAFVKSELLAQLIQPLSELLYVPAFLAVFAYAWYAEVAPSSLLAFLLLLYRMQPPLKRLDQARVLLASYAPGVAAVAELRGSLDVQQTASNGRAFPGLRTAIEFRSVSFGYSGTSWPAVRDVSFRIERGQVVAIVGRSGAGKSTLVNLLCGLYRPQSGVITVDGVPLDEFDQNSWRSRVALAGQDAELLGRSVAENIGFGRTNATADEVRKAARRASAEEFIQGLPQRYDTVIASRGSSLSGGERQRLGLARAFIREPDLLILDEATNAVDNITESTIRESLEAIRPKSTIIIIAHRLSTVSQADHVVVLSEGRVVEQGSPDLVIGMSGEFARMYELE